MVKHFNTPTGIKLLNATMLRILYLAIQYCGLRKNSKLNQTTVMIYILQIFYQIKKLVDLYLESSQFQSWHIIAYLY